MPCAHAHHNIDPSQTNERRLWLAIIANMGLTLAQVIGGIVSGSLSLIADALHNFSDAAAIILAVIAVRIGRKPADQGNTYGYKRAETIAALINLTTLMLIGLYLIFEAITRFLNPEPITGLIVIVVAGIALAVDLYTAFLTYRQSKHNMNMRAVFLHNLTDALASVGVIVSGVLILYFDMYWVDAAVTLLIAGYVLWHGMHDMPNVIHLLMDGTPKNININSVIEAMESLDGVEDVHHVHIRNINEDRLALEAHVVLCDIARIEEIDDIKAKLKALLLDQFKIDHSTLEFEHESCGTHHHH